VTLGKNFAKKGAGHLARWFKGKRPQTKKRGESWLTQEFEHSELLRIASVIALVALVLLVLAGLFAPGLRYSLVPAPTAGVETRGFLNELEPMVLSKVTENNQFEILDNGENFYKAELEAMRQAHHSINIEAYIFHKGRVTDQVLKALEERARAGVRVNLVIDALGSLATQKRYFKELEKAGGQVQWYHPLRLHNWFVANNRTHREITIVDGTTAFVGGAGYADWWQFAVKGKPSWRDTMVKAQGQAVRGLQGAFLENWVESSGEILDGPDYFPALGKGPGEKTGLIVSSTPSSGGSTRARVLFQTLIAAAQKSIDITTPYFLPDEGMRKELVRARRRGVKVRIIVPGKHDDHALTRSSGRSAYGDLLEAGAEVHEYEKSMIHAKVTIVDGIWSVIGSTNMDNRSFGINDEINLAAFDAQTADRLTHDFEEDISQSRRVTLQEWKKRSIWERLLEWLGWVIERQQ
jgi:cardiolipin synthase